MMSFDECPPFDESYDYVKKSVERTSRWAERGLKAHANPDRQGLFGIIQGAGFEDLRRQSAKDVIHVPFRAIRVGKTQSNMSTPRITPSINESAAPTPIK